MPLLPTLKDLPPAIANGFVFGGFEKTEDIVLVFRICSSKFCRLRRFLYTLSFGAANLPQSDERIAFTLRC